MGGGRKREKGGEEEGGRRTDKGGRRRGRRSKKRLPEHAVAIFGRSYPTLHVQVLLSTSKNEFVSLLQSHTCFPGPAKIHTCVHPPRFVSHGLISGKKV
jgi:hypothetical protein